MLMVSYRVSADAFKLVCANNWYDEFRDFDDYTGYQVCVQIVMVLRITQGFSRWLGGCICAKKHMLPTMSYKQ